MKYINLYKKTNCPDYDTLLYKDVYSTYEDAVQHAKKIVRGNLTYMYVRTISIPNKYAYNMYQKFYKRKFSINLHYSGRVYYTNYVLF